MSAMRFGPAFTYDIIYALAARDGREAALFGSSYPITRDAFARTPMGPDFPELWFEIPLSGSPWFDLHVLTSHDSLRKNQDPDMAAATSNDALLEWLATTEGTRQIAYSWDTGSGRSDEPAVQLLVATRDPRITCDFLEVAGRPDASTSYRAFRKRMPSDWFACYTGVFPSRPNLGTRVECIPHEELQRAYAQSPALLVEHLHQVGLDNLDATIVPRCQLLAQAPFQIEFQFDVLPDGSAGPTFGASARFACPPGTEKWAAFETGGPAGELMQRVEQWGLADSRWKLLEDTVFSKRLSRGSSFMNLRCYPAFLKLRWRNGEPLDAKSYLIAEAQ